MHEVEERRPYGGRMLSRMQLEVPCEAGRFKMKSAKFRPQAKILASLPRAVIRHELHDILLVMNWTSSTVISGPEELAPRSLAIARIAEIFAPRTTAMNGCSWLSEREIRAELRLSFSLHEGARCGTDATQN